MSETLNDLAGEDTSLANCSIEDCTNKPHTRGVCQGHYKKLLGTDALPRLNNRAPNRSLCTVRGCSTRMYARKLCRKHYNRKMHHGHPDLMVRKKDMHGTSASYNAGCRCELCLKAKREYAAEWQKKRQAELECGTSSKYDAGCRCNDCYQAHAIHLGETSEHGTPQRYVAKCRCDDCKRAYSEYKQSIWDTNPAYRLRARARQLNQRARRHRVEGQLSGEELVEFIGDKECHCGGTASVIPTVDFTAGGSNTLDNLTITCTKCREEL